MSIRRHTMSARLKCYCSAVALSLQLGAVDTVLAQGGDTLNVELGECVELQSEAERFACYEARVNAALGARETAAAAETAEPASDAAAPAPVRNAEARSNATEPADSAADARPTRDDESAPRSAQGRGRDRPEEPSPDAVVGTITELREVLPNSYVITLDNGEVWRQVRPKWYPLRPGLEVRIYPTRWGSSMRLTAVDGNSYIQVQRVE